MGGGRGRLRMQAESCLGTEGTDPSTQPQAVPTGLSWFCHLIGATLAHWVSDRLWNCRSRACRPSKSPAPSGLQASAAPGAPALCPRLLAPGQEALSSGGLGSCLPAGQGRGPLLCQACVSSRLAVVRATRGSWGAGSLQASALIPVGTCRKKAQGTYKVTCRLARGKPD